MRINIASWRVSQILTLSVPTPQDFAATACTFDDVPLSTLYVNATPVGMQGQAQHSLLPPDAPPDAVAFDLVYVPEDTPFLRDARARGMRTVTGTAMFVAQAAATFERWFGVTPSLAETAV